MRRNTDLLKQKVDGDEIDSLNTLLNELYERILQLENTGKGGAFQNDRGDGNSFNAGDRRTSVRFPTMNLTKQDTSRIKDLGEQITNIMARIDKQQG